MYPDFCIGSQDQITKKENIFCTVEQFKTTVLFYFNWYIIIVFVNIFN